MVGQKNLLDKIEISLELVVRFGSNFKYITLKIFYYHLMHLTKALKSKVAEILIGPNTKENYTFHQHLGQRQLPLT